VSGPVGSAARSRAYNYSPAAAASGELLLVAWTDPRAGTSNWNVHAQGVQPDGTLLDGPGFAVTTAPNDQTRPAVAWDGGQFIVAFEDRRAATFFLDRRADVYAARVDAAGQVLDPSGFAIAAGATLEMHPDVAASNGRAAFAAAIFQDRQPLGAFRIGIRVSPPPPVTIRLLPQSAAVAPGGVLTFEVEVRNVSAVIQSPDGWLDAIRPNGVPYGGNPILGPRPAVLSPGQSIRRIVRLRVPSQVPPSGPYTIRGTVGAYPSLATRSSSFSFYVR
jgi:hypothetical protein